MKRFGKIILFVIILSLLSVLFISFAVSAETEENISASGRFGELNWKFSKDSGIMTVFGEGQMIAPSYYDYWYTYAPFVRTLVIEEGAQNIAGGIFDFCNKLEAVSLPDSVTSIEGNAFSGCTYLTEIIIPDAVCEIGENAFEGCTSLIFRCNRESYAESFAKSHDIRLVYLDVIDYGSCGENVSWTFDNKGVLRIFGTGSMDDYNYTSDIPWYRYVGDIKIGIIEDGVENIGQATFYKCTFLEKVSLGKDIETVGISAFYNCTSLNEVKLPDGVKNINKLSFYKCSSLSKLEIPEGVESIGESAFFACKALTEIVFPKSLKAIGSSSYSECDALKSVDASACEATIDKYAFSGCISLENVKLPGTLKLLSVGMFKGCKSLKDLDIPASVETIEADAFNRAVFSGTLTLHYGVKDIQSGAFSHCELKSLVLPESVERIGNSGFRDSMVRRLYILHDIENVGLLAFWHASTIICCWPDSTIIDYARADSCGCSLIDPVVDYAKTKISVKYVEGVKEILIAKGKRDDYESVESNLVFRSGSKPLKVGQPFSYTVNGGGVYTVCVVYSDRNIIRHIKADILKPVFTENGLQLKVSNITGAKLIRVAYGDHDSIGQISRAEGERSFTSRDVLKNRSDYTIQFRKEGLVTVAVRYNNGYIVYYKYNVTKKSPVMSTKESIVTFDALSDLKVLRYVSGEYATSKEIKNAPGVVNIRGKDINASESLQIDLKPGVYSFCVQYDDESYNYYRVVIE